MDSTSVKLPEKRDTPAEDVVLVPDDRQRTPTLHSYGEPGGHGPVNDWAPSGCLQRWTTLFMASIAVGAIWLGITTWHHSWPLGILYVLLGIGALGSFQIQWRRPVYITTDENGIAVTSEKRTATLLFSGMLSTVKWEKRSIPLQWSDIVAVERRDDGHTIMIKAASQLWPIKVRLSGHSPLEQLDIVDYIAARAGLTVSPKNRNRFVRAPLAAPSENDTGEAL